MPQKPVDYGALAAQHGGVAVDPPVDYAALAAEVDGTAAAASTAAPAQEPGFLDRLRNQNIGQVAYQASPLPLFEKRNLPATAATVAGAFTGGTMAIPVAAATGMAVRGATGGTPEEAVTEGLIQGGGQALGPIIGAGKAMAPRIMQWALKPESRSVAREIWHGVPVPQVVQTMLDEGVNVTRGGAAKLRDLLTQSHAATTEIVQSLTGSIQPKTVAAYVAPVAQKFAKRADAADDLKAIGEAVDHFLNHPVYKGKLSPVEAQAMKVETYSGLKGKFDRVAAGGIEAEKAIAHGLKEELEAIAADQGKANVRELNARTGRLIEALEAVTKRVAQEGGTDPSGLALLANSKAAAVAMILKRSPIVRSLVARGMFKAAAPIAGVSPELLRAGVMAVAMDEAKDQEVR